MRKIDYKYLFFMVSMLAASFIAAYFLHARVRYNKDLLGLVANIFSILTGFLLLVITTSADSFASNKNLSKSKTYAEKRKFQIRFNRYMSLFYMYLIVLFCIFLYYMMIPSEDQLKVAILRPSKFSVTLEFIICWLSILSFGCSFFIPVKLKQLYEEKLNKTN